MASAMAEGAGTTACPLCGKGEPHYHHPMTREVAHMIAGCMTAGQPHSAFCERWLASKPHIFNLAEQILALRDGLKQQQAVSGDVVERVTPEMQAVWADYAGPARHAGHVRRAFMAGYRAALTASGMGRMGELEAFAKAVPDGSANELCPWCLSCDHWAGCVELCPAPSSRAVTKALTLPRTALQEEGVERRD